MSLDTSYHILEINVLLLLLVVVVVVFLISKWQKMLQAAMSLAEQAIATRTLFVSEKHVYCADSLQVIAQTLRGQGKFLECKKVIEVCVHCCCCCCCYFFIF